MALRFSEEPTSRLSPKEAREFLRVHAEREAKAAADAPTVDDLAETLGLTPEEAQSILQEARARTAPPKAKPRTASQQEAHIATIILGCASVAVACFLLAAPGSRIAPPTHTVPAMTPAPVPSALQPIAAPALSHSPPAPSHPTPPEGFHIVVGSPAGTFSTSGPETGFAPDYRSLDAVGAASIQTRLIATCLDDIQSSLDARPMSYGTFSLSIALRNGRPTKLVVPIGPNATVEGIRDVLAKVVGAAWPSIVR